MSSHSASLPGPDDAALGTTDALAQLSFAVQNALARRGAAHDLSMTQVRLLGILRDRTPGMQDLARLLELDKSSVTGLVDRAARRGLVRREPSADDRRVSLVVLTDEGRALVDAVSERFTADVTSLLEVLSPRDVTSLTRIAGAVALSKVQAGAGGDP